MTISDQTISIAITAGITSVTTLVAIIITYALTKKREHEADWRKLKFSQYQEFVLALSGVVRERATDTGQRRYADAVNSMALVAPLPVLKALQNFQDEISYTNRHNRKTDQRHDELLNILFREMRRDIHPKRPHDDPAYRFRLLSIPPSEAVTPPASSSP